MKPLLTIAPPTVEFPPDILQSAGGFLWWYTDMIDAERNGLVLIWSFGLPFLPGYTSAARAGAPQRPIDRPSLSVAVMQRGQLVCYLLHEFRADDATWNGSSWQFGDSHFSSAVANGRRTLDVRLDCPMPGAQRLEGTVRLEGVARAAQAADDHELRHDWAPLTGPATTEVDLTAGSQRYQFQGQGYFDGNVGRAPLHDAGIASWTWGRVPGADRQRIYYILWPKHDAPPEATGVEIDEAGKLTRFPLEATVVTTCRGRAGLSYPCELELRRGDAHWLQVSAAQMLDDGPFYLRYFVDTDAGAGFGEYCRTDRIDLWQHRPLVRMRVQQATGDNSFWLPLFAGPRDGRVGRLLSQLRSR